MVRELSFIRSEEREGERQPAPNFGVDGPTLTAYGLTQRQRAWYDDGRLQDMVLKQAAIGLLANF